MTQGRQAAVVAFLCILAVIAQGLVAHAIAIRSARPDIPLVVLACGSTLVGGVWSSALGLLTGYLAAVLSPTLAFGSLLTSRTLAGGLGGGLSRIVNRDSLWTPAIAVLLCTLLAEAIFAIMAPAAWLHRVRLYLWTIGGELLYNTALAYPVYYLMRRLGIGFRPEDPFAPAR